MLTELRAYSPNILANPIDFTYLTTPSDKPNILVTVNGLLSVCTGDCSYTFIINPPQLTAASISTSILTLNLTDPSMLGYPLTDVTITLDGQPCTIIDPSNSSIDNFQCRLPTNTDGTPIVRAGIYLPVVNIANVGIVQPALALPELPFQLSLTAINPAQGGQHGGYEATLSGIGFPLIIPGTTITMCGHLATILSITNIKAIVILPTCETNGSKDVFLSNGVNTTNIIQFDYTSIAPPLEIYTVTPQSCNPSLKAIMLITGVGFGTNMANVRVDLANSSGKVYGMRIV